MRRTASILLVVLSASIVVAAQPETVVVKVVGVSDGDSLTVLDRNNKQHRVRLHGIDAPESKQDYGTQAKKALSEKAFGKTIRLQQIDTDRYGRIVANVYIARRWINFELVRDGLAWHYKRYSDSKQLADAENKARKAKKGLWSQGDPVPPWEYRKQEAEKRKGVQ